LRGNPAEMPVIQSAKFNLDLKTAKALGLDVIE
jgi:hypothetical protein